MNLFYPNDSKSYLMGYADACYLLDSYNVTMVDHEQDICSHVVAQNDFMVVYETNHNNNIVKSCRILAFHEVSRECV